MTTYKFHYLPKDGASLTGYFDGLNSDEDAAWHAKNFCDHYGHTLLDVKPIKEKNEKKEIFPK